MSTTTAHPKAQSELATLAQALAAPTLVTAEPKAPPPTVVMAQAEALAFTVETKEWVPIAVGYDF